MIESRLIVSLNTTLHRHGQVVFKPSPMSIEHERYIHSDYRAGPGRWILGDLPGDTRREWARRDAGRNQEESATGDHNDPGGRTLDILRGSLENAIRDKVAIG